MAVEEGSGPEEEISTIEEIHDTKIRTVVTEIRQRPKKTEAEDKRTGTAEVHTNTAPTDTVERGSSPVRQVASKKQQKHPPEKTEQTDEEFEDVEISKTSVTTKKRQKPKPTRIERELALEKHVTSDDTFTFPDDEEEYEEVVETRTTTVTKKSQKEETQDASKTPVEQPLNQKSSHVRGTTSRKSVATHVESLPDDAPSMPTNAEDEEIEEEVVETRTTTVTTKAPQKARTVDAAAGSSVGTKLAPVADTVDDKPVEKKVFTKVVKKTGQKPVVTKVTTVTVDGETRVVGEETSAVDSTAKIPDFFPELPIAEFDEAEEVEEVYEKKTTTTVTKKVQQPKVTSSSEVPQGVGMATADDTTAANVDKLTIDHLERHIAAPEDILHEDDAEEEIQTKIKTVVTKKPQKPRVTEGVEPLRGDEEEELEEVVETKVTNVTTTTKKVRKPEVSGAPLPSLGGTSDDSSVETTDHMLLSKDSRSIVFPDDNFEEDEELEEILKTEVITVTTSKPQRPYSEHALRPLTGDQDEIFEDIVETRTVTTVIKKGQQPVVTETISVSNHGETELMVKTEQPTLDQRRDSEEEETEEVVETQTVTTKTERKIVTTETPGPKTGALLETGTPITKKPDRRKRPAKDDKAEDAESVDIPHTTGTQSEKPAKPTKEVPVVDTYEELTETLLCVLSKKQDEPVLTEVQKQLKGRYEDLSSEDEDKAISEEIQRPKAKKASPIASPEKIIEEKRVADHPEKSVETETMTTVTKTTQVGKSKKPIVRQPSGTDVEEDFWANISESEGKKTKLTSHIRDETEQAFWDQLKQVTEITLRSDETEETTETFTEKLDVLEPVPVSAVKKEELLSNEPPNKKVDSIKRRERPKNPKGKANVELQEIEQVDKGSKVPNRRFEEPSVSEETVEEMVERNATTKTTQVKKELIESSTVKSKEAAQKNQSPVTDEEWYPEQEDEITQQPRTKKIIVDNGSFAENVPVEKKGPVKPAESALVDSKNTSEFTTEADTMRTTERVVTEQGTVEEVQSVSTRTRLTREPQPFDKSKIVEVAEVGANKVDKLVVEKPIEIYVIEDESGEKTEIEVEQRNGKLYDVKTGKEVEIDGYDTGSLFNRFFRCSERTILATCS